MSHPYPRNFSRSELTASATATRFNIDNTPSTDEVEKNLAELAHWLQKLRGKLSQHYGRTIPITVTSGYRSLALNPLIGGSKKSAHCYGLAADIRVHTLTPKEVCEFIHKHAGDMLFDQCIDEFGSWVHIGLRQPKTNKVRRQFLQARKVGKKTVYAPTEYL